MHYEFCISLLSLVTGLLLTGCQTGHTGNAAPSGDTLALGYAKGLSMVTYDGYTEVKLRNPWDTTLVLAHYCLFEQGSTAPQTQATPIPVPIKNAGVLGSIYCQLLRELQADEAICGVCDLKFCPLHFIKERVAKGVVEDFGSSMNPNLERLVAAHPEALLLSPLEGDICPGYVSRMNIPVIYCADYMEDSPLARAEWIRFYGRLFGKAAEADSIFDAVACEYQGLKALAARTSHRPCLLPEMPWNGQWMLPAAGSTSARLYADAGAKYLFSDREGTGSIPLATEHVVERGAEADIWLIRHNGSLSRRQMVADTPLLSVIEAPIWWCDTSLSLVYEETTFHPELLLENLIAVLHLELNMTSRKSYFTPLP